MCVCFFFHLFSLCLCCTRPLFPELPRKKRMDFLFAERRDERKAVRTQDIRDIKGLKQRILNAWDNTIRTIPVHSIHERTASLILFICHFFHKDFSVRTVDTTSTFPVYFFSNSLFIQRLFFSLNHLQKTFLADSVCKSLRLYIAIILRYYVTIDEKGFQFIRNKFCVE